eukprot:2758241-Alexandrium_andersonii.AAC.1
MRLALYWAGSCLPAPGEGSNMRLGDARLGGGSPRASVPAGRFDAIFPSSSTLFALPALPILPAATLAAISAAVAS